VTKPDWILKAVIIIAALSSQITPLNTAWSQTTSKPDNARPAVTPPKPSQASKLKSGVRPGGAPATAVAAKLDGAIATNPSRSETAEAATQSSHRRGQKTVNTRPRSSDLRFIANFRSRPPCCRRRLREPYPGKFIFFKNAL
jgi:hypothetical protein